MKNELEIPNNNLILLSVGELSKRKNHSVVIKTLKGIDNVTYLICGKGKMDNDLLLMAKKNLI